jgi:hypothetical protein
VIKLKDQKDSLWASSKIVGAGIMAFFKKFHESCKFEKSLNASFIALIHKK